MSDAEKITLSDLKERYPKGLLIPEIQRDYVMGAGGKDGKGKDKLTGLLDAILEKATHNEDFDFSCIITYCKDDDRQNQYLEIYDGQQRLTTLILLTLYRLQTERKTQNYRSFAGWYRFAGRPVANHIVDMLSQDGFSKEMIEVQDFTSFSMKNLLDTFSASKYTGITADYLLHRVRFDKVEMGSQNEIEQFFMDLNAGVKLKEYEIYKAKLIHYIGVLQKQEVDACKKNMLKCWPLKLDNEWLNMFQPYSSFEHPAEEYEVQWIRCCLRMFCKEEKKEFKQDAFSFITSSMLCQLYEIMENLAKLKIQKTQKAPNSLEKSSFKGLLKYSLYSEKAWYWSKRSEQGVFYNLEFEDYKAILQDFIEEILLKPEYGNVDMDVLLWSYATTLKWNREYQYEYLRILKILLNHNVVINRNAWYASQDEGQRMYYCKYCVYGVPQYYGVHLKDSRLCGEENSKDNKKKRQAEAFRLAKKRLADICQLSIAARKLSWQGFSLDRKQIALEVMDGLYEKAISEEINAILKKRRAVMDKYDYVEFLCKEEKVLGIADKVDATFGKNYLANVTLSWPTRGKDSVYENVWVLLPSSYDLLYEPYQEGNDKCVQRFEELLAEYPLFSEKNNKYKFFWLNVGCALRLCDRTSTTATSYAKKDSDSEYWAWQFSIDEQNRVDARTI